ncbi:MAG TPA: sugar ABC transporter substrate-binding protein [Fimbriimonadaceae bacterium]|nr:sugar ABC transporter substrate-binding protein [Fimbriimonadaceae bacterium]
MIRFLTLTAFALLVGRIVWIANRPDVDEGREGVVTVEMCVWGMPFENALYTDVYIPEFERQNPGIKVKFHHFEDYGNRLRLTFAGGIAPDVMRMSLDSGPAYIRKGTNLALDKYIDGPDGIDRKDFIEILWDGLEFEGKTYGLPQDINIIGLFYNKDLFDKKGLAYPNENWTWEDLKSAAEKLTEDTDRDGRPEVIGLHMGWGGYGFRPFLYQAGGRIWNEDKSRTVIDSPEAVRALQYYKSLMTSYSLAKSDSQRGGLGPDKFFEAGKVAMFMDGSWRSPSLKNNAPKLNFGVAPLPKGDFAMSISTSCFWGISRGTRHPDAAWKLAKFLSSTPSLIDYWQTLWVAPPARWSSLRSEEYRRVTGVGKSVPGIDSEAEFEEKCGWIKKVLERGWTTIDPTSPYIAPVMLHLNEAVDRVLLEDADPAEVLKVAAERANRQIAEMRAAEAATRR